MKVDFVRRLRPLLGTFVEIGAPEVDAIELAFAKILEVQNLLSAHDPNSELSRLNSANGRWVKLSPLSARVLRLARWATRASQGAFNCTVGGRMQNLGGLPKHHSHLTLEVGHFNDLEFKGRLARLKRGVQVTLDGFAKGYAVDQAIQELKRQGMVAGWVNAGGDLRVFGDFELPLFVRGSEGFVRVGQISNAALATSEVREELSLRFPGQIVGEHEPAFGSWSVVASRAWLADALTKVAGLARDSERSARVAKLGGQWVSLTKGQTA